MVETIQEIFSNTLYDSWKPKVENMADGEGNKIIKLIMIFKEKALARIVDTLREQFPTRPLLPLLSRQDHFFREDTESKVEVHEARENQKQIRKSGCDLTPREKEASNIISKMESNNIIFKNKKCLDVGCRSGENALAMQNAGAKVVAIDPDDRQFETAVKIGLSQNQLHKLTLQEYYQLNPKRNLISPLYFYTALVLSNVNHLLMH